MTGPSTHQDSPKPIDRGVYVGCAYPSVITGRKHQAACSCGWRGPKRRKLPLALEDRDKHVSPSEVEKALDRICEEANTDA